LVEAVLKRFPGAEIVAVHPPGGAAPESDAGEGELPIEPEDER
jgi:hypothetical protein